MSDNNLKCPKCGTKIEIDQEIIARKVRDNIEVEVKKRLESDFEARLTKEKELLEKQIIENQDKELAILKIDLKTKNKKIEEFRTQELKLIKEKNEIEEARKNLEVETQRKLFEEKKQIEEKILKQAEEMYQFKILEKEKQLEDQKKLIAEMQRKAQQGSMQTQGEVLELTLEETLKKKFPDDQIEPVGKGVSGADIVQKVLAPNGETAGIIIWETKQTKAWVEEWVSKLKDDGHRVKANLMVLATNILPKGIDHFGQYKGIWVTDFSSYLGLTAALRNNLLSIYSVALANENSQDKAQILYKHITSQSFVNRINTIMGIFTNMKDVIDKEKRAYENLWAVREKQIERLTSNTGHLFGEMQGIIGGDSMGIEMLENISYDTPLIKEKSQKTEKETKKPDNQTNLF